MTFWIGTNVFDFLFKDEFPDDAAACASFWVHKVHLMDPEYLISLGIPVYRVLQDVGLVVITSPLVFHWGYNEGLNIAEAVNVSTVKTLMLDCAMHFYCTCIEGSPVWLRRYFELTYPEKVPEALCSLRMDGRILTFAKENGK